MGIAKDGWGQCGWGCERRVGKSDFDGYEVHSISYHGLHGQTLDGMILHSGADQGSRHVEGIGMILPAWGQVR